LSRKFFPLFAKKSQFLGRRVLFSKNKNGKFKRDIIPPKRIILVSIVYNSKAKISLHVRRNKVVGKDEKI